MKIEVVYFLQQNADGPIKIGRTRNIVSRIAQMASSNSCEIIVRAIIPGSLDLETQLHDRFVAHRIRGEWFHPHQTILEYIASLPDVLLRDLKYRRKKRKGLTLEQAKEVWADVNIPGPQARLMIGWGNAKIGRVLGWTRPVGRQRQGLKSAAISTARKGTPQADFTPAQLKDAKAIWRNVKDYPTWPDAAKALALIVSPNGQKFTTARAYKLFGKRL